MSGLIANQVLSDIGECTVFEPGRFGGEFTSGGLKYIHRTSMVESWLQELDLPYSSYTVRGGILLRGQLYHYPEVLKTMPDNEARKIQEDHYRKTRKTIPGEHSQTAMNDPAATGPRKACRCNFEDLISTLSQRVARHVPYAVEKIDLRGNFVVSGSTRHFFDQIVVTIPLWALRNVLSTSGWKVPECASLLLNLAQVEVLQDNYAGYDYVYTPYTPSQLVHRISPHENGYTCEINGMFELQDLLSDIAFLFPAGYTLKDLKTGLKGHLLPLAHEPILPSNVHLLGRFAKWDSRATTDVTLADARKIRANLNGSIQENMG